MNNTLRKLSIRRDIALSGAVVMLFLAFAIQIGKWWSNSVDSIAASKAKSIASLRRQSFEDNWKCQQFERDARVLTPRDAVDCGTAGAASFQKSRVFVDACAIQAWKARKAFHASYIYSELDWGTEEKLIGTAKGSVYFLRRSTGDGCRVAPIHLCEHPTVILVKGKRRLYCPDEPRPQG